MIGIGRSRIERPAASDKLVPKPLHDRLPGLPSGVMGILQSDAAAGRIASGEATRPLALLAAVWGVTGVLAIIGFAVYRLAPVGLAAFEGSFGIFEWTVFARWMGFMVDSAG